MLYFEIIILIKNTAFDYIFKASPYTANEVSIVIWMLPSYNQFQGGSFHMIIKKSNEKFKKMVKSYRSRRSVKE